MNLSKTVKSVYKKYGVNVVAEQNERSIIIYGEASDWQTVVEIGKAFVDKKSGKRVVNNVKLIGRDEPAPLLPAIRDTALQDTQWDVVVIGGGISGCAVARELSKYKLKVLLCEKHSDVARGASGANDGMVHAGIDLKHKCLKLHYVTRGNAMYENVCKDLGVEFVREGQYVVFSSRIIKFLARSYLSRARKHNIPNVRMIGKKEICRTEPTVKDFAIGALKIPSTGAVSPYKLTIAYAENAVQNGATVSLDTAVLSMEHTADEITRIVTNRGSFTAKCVINCAGVFADKIAEMADDRYFSLHPRKGADLLMDPKGVGLPTHSISLGPTLKTLKQNKNTKGGGIVKTADGNILLGPNACEVYEREDTSTSMNDVNEVFEKQRKCCPSMQRGNVIAYFAGVRACTYEEDFIIERSSKVKNLIHVAGIQSPGLTAAPAFSIDVAEMTAELLRSSGETVEKNPDYNPVRKSRPDVKNMTNEERDELIKSNPDYGEIICRCEEVSLGEIKEAINNPLGVATIDGVKRRVRAGMGRCQGGFCMPLVVKTIAEELKVPYSDVMKADKGSYVAIGEIKRI
ncbi:MAG: NAD(P)/FAD-dependent oxidoreductase [Corallococcus sp.]|nr:NAD(P)/FAD-dependent oxidoreductase [Bacillota bacterium]MCM1533767.1 NAD(P)/FAD-dependent oxidoreductase [Corallococcus sp.]